MDAFGATPFIPAENKEHIASPELLLQEDRPDDTNPGPPNIPFDDNFVVGNAEGRSDLANFTKQLEEFAVDPFGIKDSPSSSDHEEDQPNNSSKMYDYKSFDADSLEVKQDEDHLHRGLLDRDESTDEESEEESDQQDYEEDTGSHPLVESEHDVDDSELAMLNLTDFPQPAIGQLIDTDDSDPFQQAPFKIKSKTVQDSQDAMGTCTLTPPMSPPGEDEDPDPFGSAPFKGRPVQRQGSRTSSNSESSDIFSKAPFPSAKKRHGNMSDKRKAKSQHTSKKHSAATGNPTPPVSPIDDTKKNPRTEDQDLFGSVPFDGQAVDNCKQTLMYHFWFVSYGGKGAVVYCFILST